jgi:sugar phosphate isomerase/epimerase
MCKKLKTLICIVSALALMACQPKTQTSKAVAQEAIPKVSVQLYSVKDQLEADFSGTLQQIADMGFQGVEFAGIFGPYKDDPKGLKAFLHSIGLEVSGAHVRASQLTPEHKVQTIAFYQALGAPMLLIPWDDRSIQPENIDSLVSQLNELAKELGPLSMKVGYHNHDDELAPFKDSTYLDYLAQNTTDDIVLQLDVGWVTYAQKDPVEYVKRYPGRIVTTHYKAMLPKGQEAGHKPFIGQDVTEWDQLLKANISHGGTLWLVVEQEEYPDNMSQLEALKVSKQGLDKVIESLQL